MGFCGWPVTIPAEWVTEWDEASPELRATAESIAGQVLWTLTGEVFTVCEQTVRPCFAPVDSRSTYHGRAGRAGAVFWPGLVSGDPTASGPCGCSTDCRHVGQDRVALPGPVASIIEVVIDGTVIDRATYRVQNRRWLRRTDGQLWPQHQDLNAADDGAGAFTVRYRRGIPVPPQGQVMAGRLAVEFLRGLRGGECSLPSGATSASRQGISVDLADVREWFTNGLTGVEIVDLWIMSVNPYKSKRPSRITSPDRAVAARFR